MSSAQPGLVRAYCADAERFLYQDRLSEAAAAVGNALRLSPHDPAALNISAVIDLQDGRLDAAAAKLRRVIALQPQAPEPHHFLGLAYEHMARFAEAAAEFEQALALRPGIARTLSELARMLAILGRHEEARARLLELIELDAEDVLSYLFLAETDPAALNAAHVLKLRGLLDNSALDVRARAFAGFALAAYHEARGDHDREFACLDLANAHMRAGCASPQQAPVGIMPRTARPKHMSPREAMNQLVDARSFAETMFTTQMLARHAGTGHPSSLPIFIVGMPRSGSSLIEQILSSHPAVHGAGEISAFHQRCISGQWPYEGYYRRDTLGAMVPSDPRPRHFRILGSNYVKAIRPLAPRAQRIVNKMPGLFMHIGMIHLTLPNAIIIHSVRDPADTCLGCYKQHFLTGHETTYDLSLLGQHYQEYRRVMTHWQRVLPGRVIDVVYEELVRDPEPQIRRLLEICGLPWHEGCLRPQDNSKPVLSASQLQVRKPIYQTAVQRWRRYEQHLAPLFAALGPYAPQDAKKRSD